MVLQHRGYTEATSAHSGEDHPLAQRFASLANRAAALAGHYLTFILALALILVWAITDPMFAFSDTWQLVINTGTTLDGLLDSEHPEPGGCGDAPQAG